MSTALALHASSSGGLITQEPASTTTLWAAALSPQTRQWRLAHVLLAAQRAWPSTTVGLAAAARFEQP